MYIIFPFRWYHIILANEQNDQILLQPPSSAGSEEVTAAVNQMIHKDIIFTGSGGVPSNATVSANLLEGELGNSNYAFMSTHKALSFINIL